MSHMGLVRRYDPKNEEALRQFAMPVELLPKLTSAPHNGGYRYFRAPNIVPIEHWRLSGQKRPPTGLAAKVLLFSRQR